MSVTNAISGIIVVGGLVLAVQIAGAATWIGAIAFSSPSTSSAASRSRGMLRMFRK